MAAVMGLAGSTEGEETIVTETIGQATGAVCNASNAVRNASSYVYETAAYYTGFAAPTGNSLATMAERNQPQPQPLNRYYQATTAFNAEGCSDKVSETYTASRAQ